MVILKRRTDRKKQRTYLVWAIVVLGRIIAHHQSHLENSLQTGKVQTERINSTSHLVKTKLTHHSIVLGRITCTSPLVIRRPTHHHFNFIFYVETARILINCSLNIIMICSLGSDTAYSKIYY